MAKTGDETYRQKASPWGWLILAVLIVLIIIQVGELRLRGSDQAKTEPEKALRQYCQKAQEIIRKPAAAITQLEVDAMLDLVTQEDRDWFEKNFRNRARYEQRGQEHTPMGELGLKATALKSLVERGFSKPQFDVVDSHKKARSTDLKIRDGNRTITVNMRKEKGLYYVTEFAGGR